MEKVLNSVPPNPRFVRVLIEGIEMNLEYDTAYADVRVREHVVRPYVFDTWDYRTKDYTLIEDRPKGRQGTVLVPIWSIGEVAQNMDIVYRVLADHVKWEDE